MSEPCSTGSGLTCHRKPYLHALRQLSRTHGIPWSLRSPAREITGITRTAPDGGFV
ncbi:MAG: hypothetical protein PHU23_08550 [Dehalococcoidales bacterium]|nr:hypothetical protein [Dehalococcoidales bacterium]